MLTLKIRQNIHSSGCLRVENLAHNRAGSFLRMENGCCKPEEPFSEWRMVAAPLREGFSDRRKLPARLREDFSNRRKPPAALQPFFSKRRTIPTLQCDPVSCV